MSSDLVYAQREIDNLISLLADARTESMKLRAVVEKVYQSSNQRHIIEMTRAALEGE